MRKFVLGVIFLVSAIFSADNFTFEKVNNPKEVVSKAQKQSLKSKQSSQVRSYTPLPISQFVFDENLDELTSVSSGGQFLFYLAYNKVQNDPTIPRSELLVNLSENENYACDYTAQQASICSYEDYYSQVQYALNSIGGWFYFTQYPTSNDNFVLIDRKNTKRGNAGQSQSFMGGKPHFKVFVDTYGKLSVTFTLVTGGTQTVSTPQAIPLNTKVYLQANNRGIDYEVGWTTLDGVSSRASGSHQGFSIPADIDEHRVARNNKTSCQSGPNLTNINERNSGCIKIDFGSKMQQMVEFYNQKKNSHFISNFFWNALTDIFADMNKTDISNNTVFQPNTSLVVDTNFINKVYGDLFMGQNNFNANQLRVYIADNYIIADVREY
ncbi:hypothetical protein FFA43_00790 [Campylobacter hyointestinalis subsp. hyointestinalis]|uniref:hypothetical protein n=1 Tax=Campylobacter hyointestinalis TaxID=198 RepID=UPI0007239436|nr:hypothetical protein [Campylobacter hyointestinalis]PPB53616.1 hypothetical protein CDQ68_02900 [Campylobacter hyointestinalis subsp. hyointestinalis]PPB54353.1 hypothetical protein CDQ69_02745 [Campylobacter hyointestinalis subsp. hyointestinalis]PPB57902.1 hypothetical protein CDQ71_02970 [Campylobacter hyointestinalis subsp. hyointestinalis]PPB65046.1 hypothetical protein CDQ73_03085 [Campylobacter hyointestinalis subsp. hyointestinalis]PPB68191.1 hypothetical protein CDQ77_08190 [Campyl